MPLNGNPQCYIDVHCGDHILEKLTHIFSPVWWKFPYKHFDNTPETYVTDYLIGAFMVTLCFLSV